MNEAMMNFMEFMKDVNYAVVKIPTADKFTLEFDDDKTRVCADCVAGFAALKEHKDSDIHSVTVDDGTIISFETLEKMSNNSKQLFALLWKKGYLLKKEFK
jgi:hypothetical protein